MLEVGFSCLRILSSSIWDGMVYPTWSSDAVSSASLAQVSLKTMVLGAESHLHEWVSRSMLRSQILLQDKV